MPALRARRAELENAALTAPPPRPFAAGLRLRERVALIAEFKRRSPSRGPLCDDARPASSAAAYARAGAAAMSVLTEEDHFGGSLRDLGAARAAAPLPLLRKDFLIDPVQVTESRAAGADAVLLIVRILDDVLLAELLASARDCGMAALVEAHDHGELERALAAGAEVVGVNSRDLATFETDARVVLDLAGRVPPDVVLVAESGIRGPADVDRLGAAGIDAVLVGEALMSAQDAEAAARALADRPRRARGSGASAPTTRTGGAA